MTVVVAVFVFELEAVYELAACVVVAVVVVVDRAVAVVVVVVVAAVVATVVVAVVAPFLAMKCLQRLRPLRVVTR